MAKTLEMSKSAEPTKGEPRRSEAVKISGLNLCLRIFLLFKRTYCRLIMPYVGLAGYDSFVPIERRKWRPERISQSVLLWDGSTLHSERGLGNRLKLTISPDSYQSRNGSIHFLNNFSASAGTTIGKSTREFTPCAMKSRVFQVTKADTFARCAEQRMDASPSSNL